QAGGGAKTAGPAADVYALGAILYELLTNRPPFQADTALVVIMKVVNEEPRPPRELRPSIDRDLELICLKCLRKDPAQRYASAQDLALDLKRYLDGEPVQAAERWTWLRPGTWFARERARRVLVAVVAVY